MPPFLRFLLRRLLQLIPVIFAIASLNFSLLRLAPGDAADVMEAGFGGTSQTEIEALREEMGRNKSLALEPEVIVCDEPVSALDVSIQAQVMNPLADIQDRHGVAYLFISHDLSLVSETADRIVVMYLGEVVDEGTAQRFRQRQVRPC